MKSHFMSRASSMLLAAAMTAGLTIPALAAESKFDDVAEPAWYYAPVMEAVEKEYMKGYGNGLFGPEDVVTRSQMAQVLYNKYGADEGAESGFVDVGVNEWYAKSVTWAYKNGVVDGYGNGMFGPLDALNREQMVSILYKKMGKPETAGELDKFTDKDDVASWARDAMTWAVENGLIEGTSETTLSPQMVATRSQIATLILRFVKWEEALINEPDEEVVPTPEPKPEPDEEVEEKDPVFESGMEFVNSQPEVTRDILIENGMTVLTSADAVREATGINKSDEHPTVGYTAEPNINGYHTESELDLSGCVLDYEALDYIIKCKKEWKELVMSPAYVEMQGWDPNILDPVDPDFWPEEAFWVLGDAGEEMVMAAAKWPEKAHKNGAGGSTVIATSLADAIKKWNADDDWLASLAADHSASYWCFAHYTDKNGKTTYAYSCFFYDANPGGNANDSKNDYYINGIKH